MAKTETLGIAPFDPAEYLATEESIAEFLNASIEMNDPAVLLQALGTVARARSMTKLATDSGLGRESLYKAMAPGAQPRYDTVMRVLHALGVEIRICTTAQSAQRGNKSAAKKRAKKPERTVTAKNVKPSVPRRRSDDSRAMAAAAARPKSPR